MQNPSCRSKVTLLCITERLEISGYNLCPFFPDIAKPPVIVHSKAGGFLFSISVFRGAVDRVYQITDETVPDEQMGEYLDMIAKSIVFDKDTKLEISKEDLEAMDWDGNELSTQKRENWFYGEVHAIQNTNASDAVAVEINSEYRIATCQ